MGDFTVLSASIAGMKRGEHLDLNEDSFCTLNENGVCVVAVADGIGSEDNSRIGSRYAANVAAHQLALNFEAFFSSPPGELILRKRLQVDFADAVRGLYERLKKPFRESFMKSFATTLLAVAIKGDRMILVQIGNGIVGATVGQGAFVILPSRTPNGQTISLGVEERYWFDLAEKMTVRRCRLPENLNSLIIATDGGEFAQGVYMPGENAFTASFCQAYQEIISSGDPSAAQKVLDRYVALLRAENPNQDDVTVALLLHKPSHIVPRPGDPLVKYEIFSKTRPSMHTKPIPPKPTRLFSGGSVLVLTLLVILLVLMFFIMARLSANGSELAAITHMLVTAPITEVTAAVPTPEPVPAVLSMPTQSVSAVPTPSATAPPDTILFFDQLVAPTSVPTATPTTESITTPTTETIVTPTVKPTVTPTATPTVTPSVEPTATPTAEPTATPTSMPTAESTEAPTEEPTAAPSAKPSTRPATKPANPPQASSH
jgi:HAMP domain-containing protein